jgi:hypothetical protein
MPSRQGRAHAILNHAIADLPHRTYLYEPDVRDSLSDEQVATLLADGWDELAEELDEWLLEKGAGSTEGYLDQVVPEAEDRSLLREFDLLVQLEDEVHRRDRSEPLRDLLRYTTGPPLRYDLGYDVEAAIGLAGDNAWRDAAGELAEAAGVELLANRKPIEDLLLNASYGGRLQVLFSTDLERLVDALAEGVPQQIAFTDPTLLVYDRLNGSGMEAPVVGTVTRPLRAEDLHLDSGPYSWSDIVGGVDRGGYDTAVELTPLPQHADALGPAAPSDLLGGRVR